MPTSPRTSTSSAAPTLQDLHTLIQAYPIIDNHAHNILNFSNRHGTPSYPLQTCTTEASGDALLSTKNSLAHQRAVKLLAGFYACDEDWDVILKKRKELIESEEGYEELVRRSLEGTYSILIDDGLDAKEKIQSIEWHDQFTTEKNKRIMRIEAVAADILEQLFTSNGYKSFKVETITAAFCRQFETAIVEAMADKDVVGFKSVICYRSGLDVSLDTTTRLEDVRQGLRDRVYTEEPLRDSIQALWQKRRASTPVRIDDKILNGYLVVTVCEIMTFAFENSWRDGEIQTTKPFQFHTGLGDTDINLVTANPAYMQPLITRYPEVDFVLLHSAYPYTREAGYLATNYANAYLDLGEVFPMVGKEGQIQIVKEALELTPTDKLLWSTDGHWFPETFWLANVEFREVLEKVFKFCTALATILIDCQVLSEEVQCNGVDLAWAIDATKNILFRNSNSLYELGFKEPDFQIADLPSRTNLTTLSSANSTSLRSHWQTFKTQNPEVRFVWMHFLDYTSTMRTRMFPIAEFEKIVAEGRRISITTATLRLLWDDSTAPSCSPIGMFMMKPDLATLFRNAGSSSHTASVMTFWNQENGEPLEGCPRSMLSKQEQQVKSEFDLDILLGFEIEVVFMKMPATDDQPFTPSSTVHSWSNITHQQRSILPIIEEIVSALSSGSINLEQFHSESAPGQWEFVLPPASPLIAVDTLYQTRQIISFIAEKHGLKATLYPRTSISNAGTGAHMHISINPPTPQRSENFFAGIIEHLPAILAFSLPQMASYERMKPGIWSGGVWANWGTQNREAALRKCGDGHFEIKVVDGLANMYLASSAIIASGLIGLRKESKLRQDCTFVPGSKNFPIGFKGQEKYFVTKLPEDLGTALDALEIAEDLVQILGQKFVDDYYATKDGEMEFLKEMERVEGEEAVRRWLIERY